MIASHGRFVGLVRSSSLVSIALCCRGPALSRVGYSPLSLSLLQSQSLHLSRVVCVIVFALLVVCVREEKERKRFTTDGTFPSPLPSSPRSRYLPQLNFMLPFAFFDLLKALLISGWLRPHFFRVSAGFWSWECKKL